MLAPANPDVSGGPMWRTRYQRVDLLPDQRPVRLWEDGRGPAPHFARQAVGVTELYSSLLGKATPVPSNATRIAVRAYVGDDVGAPASYGDGPRKNYESVAAVLDPTLLDLPADRRPEAYLRWLQPIVLGLADVRGVPRTGFQETFDACLAAGCLLRWSGPARPSPDRQLRAVPHFEFDADGDAWLRVTLTDGRRHVITEGGPWEAPIQYRDWQRSARTLTWLSPEEVGVDVNRAPYASAWRVPGWRTLSV
ncbi:hypothetical protein [Cryptosporangium minutisporangium]|uniref:hypothetical protein n=1 Tax=Cryptosporangium minutisporangium TaxID=113569 RepID=UPI0031E71046